MSVQQRICLGLLLLGLAGTGGCGVQDSTQPPVGSISVGARKESSISDLPRGKSKAGRPAGRK